MKWSVVLIAEAQKDLLRFERNAQIQILKGIQKVSENPLPRNQGGYGKPLGRKRQINLTNLMKIKFKDLGVRVVYKLDYSESFMRIIIISVRADDEVYKEALKRRKKHGI